MTETEVDLSFSVEIPLSDLAGTRQSWDESEFRPKSLKTSQRQLAISRATIKIPDASLAFPIDQDLQSPISSTASRKQSETTFNLNDLSILIPPPNMRDKRVKVFGPEGLVEDPRIKRLFESIVRDILIVASVVSVGGWLAPCLAVPMRDLV